MKKKTFRKTFAAAVAAVCAVNAVVISNIAIADSSEIYEFENGTLNTEDRIYEGKDREGNEVEASGGKFVFLQDAGETASVEVTAEETGMYSLTISAYAAYGAKNHNLLINGVDQGQISFEENKTGFVEVPLGNFKLQKGANTITVQSSWGWTYIDYLKISKSVLPSLNVPKTISDGKATDETKRLMSYLVDTYGKQVISGQQEIYQYGPHDFEYEFNWLKENTGKMPAIRGFDFLNCANILYGSEDGTVDRMIDWANNKNGIVTASWHVTVPKNFANYEQGVTNVDWNNATYSVWADDDNGTHTKPATDFDTSKVLEEDSKENKYYMACLEALAGQLKKLQEANVPIILRPLHEAEGGGGETASWFWWGKDGSAVYRELWKLTYKTLTEKYDLHNIIWEWNSYAYATSKNWYPGDEYVDIVAYDKYNCTDYSTSPATLVHNDSAISGTFYNLVDMYDGKKMVAMAENDSIPTLTNLTEEKAAWLTFCTWYDGGSDNINFLSNEVFNKLDDLKELYNSDYCVTLDEIPENIYKTYSLEGFTEIIPPETEDKNTTEETTEETNSSETGATDDTIASYTGDPAELIYGDVDLSGSVNVGDVTKLAKYFINSDSYRLGDKDNSPESRAKAMEQSDVEHDGTIDKVDLSKLIEHCLGAVNESELGVKK